MTSVVEPKQSDFRGKLSAFGVSELLMMLGAGKKQGVLHLGFEDPSLNTQLFVHADRIGGVQSPFVPPWSSTLGLYGVSAATLERLRGDHEHTPELLEALVRSGEIAANDLHSASKQRVLMGLMPVLGRTDGEFVFVEGDTSENFAKPGVVVASLVLEATSRMDELEHHIARTIHPKSGFAVVTQLGDFAMRIAGLEQQDWRVLSLIAETGGALEAITRRSGLAWDKLLFSIAQLESRGLICPTNTRLEAERQGNSSKGKFKRLARGDTAPAFNLPGLDRNTVSLGAYRGSKIYLAFNRQAGCAFCNPRTQELMEASANLEKAGVKVISIFGSSTDTMLEHVGKLQPPFPLLSDPNDITYDLYGLEHSLLGFLNPRNLKLMMRGMKMETFGGPNDGELIRMPAEFLIEPDFTIHTAHYSAFAADFMPVDAILAWGKNG